jgi:Sortase (surface protein transpeptidase)
MSVVEPPQSGRRRATRQQTTERPRHHRPSVIGIIGELLITAGVLVFLFLGWQLWLNDIVVGDQQRTEAIQLGQSWDPAGTSVRVPEAQVDYGEPIVAAAPKSVTKFAVMYVPRFDDDARIIAEGTSTFPVLNSIGVGHYSDSQMPGQVGNFAVAAHRTTHGAPFNKIATLRVGDRIYVQTQDGYYTYVFRNLEYVKPTGVGVKDPVPQMTGITATDRIMTMTSCNPKLSAAERIVAYSVFESWQPLSAGPPAQIADLVTKGA